MRLRTASFVFATLSSARAQVTVCFATYGPEATNIPAIGLDLLIQVFPAQDALVRRQTLTLDSGYLDSTGQIQPNCQKGSIFRLASGQLSSGSEQISVRRDVSFSQFAVSGAVGAIDGIFAVGTDGSLVWNNEEFDGHTARFGADSEGILYSIFAGSTPSMWTEVALNVIHVSDCPDLLRPSTSVSALALSIGFPTFPDSYANHSMPRTPTDFRTSSTSLSSSSVAPNATSTNYTSSGAPSLITPTPSNPVNAARSIISSNGWSGWCSDLLGYTTAGSTFTFYSTMETTDLIMSPSASTVTQTGYSTSSATTVVPSNAVIIMVTPTQTTTVSDLAYDTVTTLTDIETTVLTPTYSNPNTISTAMKLRVRQASSGFFTPGALQIYPAPLLSSACSNYVSTPTSGPFVTTTHITTNIQTSDTPGSVATVDETSTVQTTMTISSGTVITVETYPVDDDVTTTEETATVSTTDIVSSTEAIIAPTDYPNCDMPVSQVSGQNVNIIDYAPNNVTQIYDSDNAYDCCVSCQTTPLCGATFFADGTCNMIMAQMCSADTPVGYYGGFYAESTGYILANGTCGILIHRGQTGNKG